MNAVLSVDANIMCDHASKFKLFNSYNKSCEIKKFSFEIKIWIFVFSSQAKSK